VKEFQLYSAMVYTHGGMVGAFRVVATSAAQAKGIANNWAFDRQIHPTNVIVTPSGRTPVYGIA
jgi:hypothetical protein